MKRLLLLFIFFTPLFPFAQKRYPTDVEAVLKQTPKNRAELEKAIDYFLKQGDSLKIKACYFLIDNMDFHTSSSFYWMDSGKNQIAFNELEYPDFTTSVSAFTKLKEKYPKIRPQTITYKDIDSIKADMLVDNIENAFKTWGSSWSKNLSFNDFCEYILPYRISIEPLQNWRKKYNERFTWINDSARGKTTPEALKYFVSDCNKWFTNTYGIEGRNEPLPRLGALQLLHRKKGPCEDIADLEVFTLRSQGIPASIDEVPYWATSSGKHYLNVAFDAGMKPISFDVSTPLITINKLNREPAKVIRTTYSKQKNVLANIESPNNIPEGFMRTLNYIDVTQEYWETKDVKCELFNSVAKPRVAYACVFNFLNWRPAWWGAVDNNEVVFSKMCKGAVFLPMYYVDGKLKPAGYPVASGYNNTMVLKPDKLNTHTIHIPEEAGYLVFRPGKNYKLFYWNNSWQLLGEKKAEETTKELVFNNVPRNALLLLLPEYSQHKERPFVITDEGNRLWW